MKHSKQVWLCKQQHTDITKKLTLLQVDIVTNF